MREKKTFFISTSIPYVNARPHLGHALEFVQADIIARYKRLLNEDVFFLSGTDDNALKNVRAAEAAGEPVADYVNKNAENFRSLLRDLTISNDDFIRTSTDRRHIAGVEKLWNSCKKEDIYKKKYKGFYCVGCEEFKTEKILVSGECPEHLGVKLEEIEEENYFFKLSNYKDQIEKVIVSGELQIIPEIRKNETLAFIKGGLEDFSISRSKERAHGWGIPVPGDESQMIYVWFDALSNYITALGYAENSEKFTNYWQEGDERVHVIGKGVNRFHTIYWPAILLSAGIRLPSKVFIHGYVTIGGEKMSKSIGNVVDPNDLIKEYGPETVRHFLAQHTHPFNDTDLTIGRFRAVYGGDLVDGLGNLVARIMQLAQTHLSTKVQDLTAPELQKEYTEGFKSYRIDQVSDHVFREIRKVDSEIDHKKPFSVVKDDPEEGKRIISDLVKNLYHISYLLVPFMPETSKKITDAIIANKKPENLFPRKD